MVDVTDSPSVEILAAGTNYEVEKRLTKGGMAEILLAWQTGPSGFRRRAVIKRPLPHLASDPEFLELFRREATIAAELSHRNIVTVYEVLEPVPGQCAIVMEYVPGQTVHGLISRAEKIGLRLRLSLVVHVITSVCDALSYAYDGLGPDLKPRGIVHRDVTPTNILLDRMGQVKLADFGIARTFSTDSVTRTGVLRGKVRYMSPEQIQGDILDQRSDLFSLATVAYELLTGIKVFERDNYAATATAIIKGEFKPITRLNPGLPGEVDAVFAKALHPDRDQRYQSAAALGDAFAALVGAEILRQGSTELMTIMSELFPQDGATDSLASFTEATGSERRRRAGTHGLGEGLGGLLTSQLTPAFAELSTAGVAGGATSMWVVIGMVGVVASVVLWVWLLL